MTVEPIFFTAAALCNCNREQQDGIKAVGKLFNDADKLRFSIMSVSETPPSTLFPLDFNEDPHRFPLYVPGTRNILAKNLGFGFEVNRSVIELRGWLTNVETDCNTGDSGKGDHDWRYDLELDPQWTDGLGLDLNLVVRAGNILLTTQGGERFVENGPLFKDNRSDGRSFYRATARPVIHLETHPWRVSEHTGINPPADWKTFADAGSCPDLLFPYHPLNPLSWQPRLRTGQYVRAVGALITDAPHFGHLSDPASWAPRTTSQSSQLTDVKRAWGGDTYTLGPTLPSGPSAGMWVPGRTGEEPDHPARWTEIHPVDVIAILDDKPSTELAIAVALLAENGIPNGKREALDFEMRPPGSRPSPNMTARVTENIDTTQTLFSTIVEGNDAGNGARMEELGDRVRIRVAVQGMTAPGSKGKFKAVYRVRWN